MALRERLLVPEIPDGGFAPRPFYDTVPTSCEMGTNGTSEVFRAVIAQVSTLSHLKVTLEAFFWPTLGETVTRGRAVTPQLQRQGASLAAKASYGSRGLDIHTLGEIQVNITPYTVLAELVKFPTMLVQAASGEIPHLLLSAVDTLMRCA